MREDERRNPEVFKEYLSDGLLAIHEELQGLGFLTPDQTELIGRICDKFNELGQWAAEIGDAGKEAMLKKLNLHFYVLLTAGVIDNLDRFNEQVAHAQDLLKIALLAMDGEVKKNKGRILSGGE